MINEIIVRNFKGFDTFELKLNAGLNIVVGNNEAKKSTILEAVALALTRRINGRLVEQELSPFLFNKACVGNFLAELKAGKKPVMPSILVELYLDDGPAVAHLRGTNNSRKADAVGLKLEILFDEDYKQEYADWLADKAEKSVLPSEYCKVQWLSFANGAITARSVPVAVFSIDATSIRLQSGTDYFVQTILSDGLSAKERVALAIAYRGLKEQFSKTESIKGINKGLTKAPLSGKDLTVGIDISQKSNWETSLVPHVDELPFQLAGKGEQTALKVMLALDRKAGDSDIILIEEPENHLSFAAMNKLVDQIAAKCAGKQLIITTHSAYVLNKLGLEHVQLLHGGKTVSLTKLPADTRDYFRKLSGYDTLRLILADRTILVEGPSDELVVQKAHQAIHEKLPIQMGVDVLNVRGLSFARFLDIAQALGRPVAVVTDNDGDYQKKVAEKYHPYAGGSIKICADNDDQAPTLEPQLLKVNGRARLNEILGTAHATDADLLAHMAANKTECALKIFDWKGPLDFPGYIKDAVT